MSRSGAKGDPCNLQLACLELEDYGTPNILTSSPVYPPFSPHSQTLAGRPRPSGNYLARQDLSSDGAAHECLHILPRLLLLHRRGGIEGNLHHGESSGCAVRRGSNQYPGLQVGRGGDLVRPSCT